MPLGPRYEGARISRDAATGEDEDEDDPFSKGFDEEESEDDVEDVAELSGSEGEDEDVSDEDEDMQDGDESPATDMSDEDDEDDEEEDDDEEVEDKTELRKMMAEEQKTVAASLSQAAKQDAEKGRAVKTQRTTFDSLLNSRIKLQKALIGTNTLTGVISDSTAPAEDTQDAFLAAETAAFTLWSTLNSLRETLESSRTGHKRKHATYTLDTPTEDLWNHMRSQELSAAPTRATILEKWNQKARGASAITPKNKLNNSSANQSIVDVLQEQLHGDRLTKRARTPRSCAPLQLASASTTSEPSAIYDDADFYGLLLQSLLEQRSADSIAASASSSVSLSLPTGFQMRREAKTKKNIDTKASKGRKMRYTVHEKLQNFMAPEDRATWAERAADELFGSLFGQRMGLGEDEDEREEEVEDEGEEAGLMMFRS